MKRKNYFDAERAFEFIWQNADCDGIWHGDAIELAAEFDVSEDAADSTIRELCDRHKIQKVFRRTYIIVNWRERDDPDSLRSFQPR